MDTVSSTLTVLFDGSFWVGIYERRYQQQLEVAKIIFGAEPKDYEVYDYILCCHHRLRFSPYVSEESLALIPKKSINPKRMHRLIEKELHTQGIGTKAQQALKLQREMQKETASVLRRERKQEMQQRIFMQKQQKKKEKHRGH